MEASRPNPAYGSKRTEELERENETLREQLRAYASQQASVRGAMHEAVGEREATERLAHQMTVEERATRSAVEVQGNTMGFAVMVQIINFFMLLVLIIGMFIYVPSEVARRIGTPSTVVAPAPGTVVVPGR